MKKCFPESCAFSRPVANLSGAKKQTICAPGEELDVAFFSGTFQYEDMTGIPFNTFYINVTLIGQKGRWNIIRLLCDMRSLPNRGKAYVNIIRSLVNKQDCC